MYAHSKICWSNKFRRPHWNKEFKSDGHVQCNSPEFEQLHAQYVDTKFNYAKEWLQKSQQPQLHYKEKQNAYLNVFRIKLRKDNNESKTYHSSCWRHFTNREREPERPISQGQLQAKNTHDDVVINFASFITVFEISFHPQTARSITANTTVKWNGSNSSSSRVFVDSVAHIWVAQLLLKERTRDIVSLKLIQEHVFNLYCIGIELAATVIAK
jgi:hypothetical protein